VINPHPGTTPSNGALDLPMGTVTFLFTDIEGSTRMLQQHATLAQGEWPDGVRMATEVGEGGVICTSLSMIADLLLDHGDHALAVRLAAAS
jgi:hypothetical protein